MRDRKKYLIGSFVTLLIMMAMFPLLGFNTDQSKAKPHVLTALEEWEGYQELQCVIPAPVPEVRFPTAEHLVEIGKLSETIVAYKIYKQGWARCGEVARPEKAEGMKKIEAWAIEWSYHIVRSAWNNSDSEVDISIIHLTALAVHESGLDECLVGPNVREEAYRRKLLKDPGIATTFEKEDVLHAVKNLEKRFSGSGVDIGPCQMLSRFYTHPTDYARMMTVDYGMAECARELRHRGRKRHTDAPWKMWPGHPSEEYRNKIDNRAAIMRSVAKRSKDGLTGHSN